MNKQILVVDDEKLIVKGINLSLTQDGFLVDCAYDGEEALDMFSKKKYDLVLLDLMLPKIDGLKVCETIRQTSNVPIIMLTAKGTDEDKIGGLESGADDYITKPFNIGEVKARIRAILRRLDKAEPKAEDEIIVRGSLKLNVPEKRVYIDEKEYNLTAKEFELLELMARNVNKVYSRDSLLKLVWGESNPGDVRTVDVHVRRLREKIEANPGEPKFVHTKWGMGYYFNAE